MSRTKVRFKVKSAPTRRGTRAQWAGARDLKRQVRFLSQPGRDQAPDLLRRLEREVGPLADALTRAEPRSVLTRAEPRSVLLRALRRTAIAGMAMAALVIAWQHIPSDARNTETTNGRSPKRRKLPDCEPRSWIPRRNIDSCRPGTRTAICSFTVPPGGHGRLRNCAPRPTQSAPTVPRSRRREFCFQCARHSEMTFVECRVDWLKVEYLAIARCTRVSSFCSFSRSV